MFALFEGCEYQANLAVDGTVWLFHHGVRSPVDDRFTKHHPDFDVWVLRVRPSDCERIVEVTTIARYKHYYCKVEALADDGTTADLYLMRDLHGRGEAVHDFDRVGQWEFRTTVPVSELSEYREWRSVLLPDETRAPVVPDSPRWPWEVSR